MADNTQKIWSKVLFGEPDEIRALIKADPKIVTLMKPDGKTLLFAAVDRDDADAVKILIEAGADVNATDTKGNTALSEAARDKKLDALKLLLAAGARADLVMSNGDPLLLVAVREGQLAIVQALLEARVDVNRANAAGWTPIFQAALACKDEPEGIPILKCLLAAGANTNAITTDDAATTPLAYIAEWGGEAATEVIPLLLAKNANINHVNKKGETPLFLATSNNQHAAINALIAGKADLNRPDDCGNTPLHHATHWQDGIAIDMLLTAGADVNAANNQGWTPIMVAAFQGNEEHVQRILKAKPDLSRREKKEGKSALQVADSPKIAELIRKYLP